LNLRSITPRKDAQEHHWDYKYGSVWKRALGCWQQVTFPATAFSILLFTESKMPSGNFPKKLPPGTILTMSTSESKTL
jgi:hypothetical protein